MIRTIEEKDIPQITEIYNRYVTEGIETFETEPLTPEQMTERIKAVKALYPNFVDDEDGRIAGFCYVHRWKERAAYHNTYETTIYLSPDFKRRGIGTAMMSRLISECRRRKYMVLIACITGCNEESIAFHRSMGFVPVSCFHGVGCKFGQRLDVVDYELQLDTDTHK